MPHFLISLCENIQYKTEKSISDFLSFIFRGQSTRTYYLTVGHSENSARRINFGRRYISRAIFTLFWIKWNHKSRVKNYDWTSLWFGRSSPTGWFSLFFALLPLCDLLILYTIYPPKSWVKWPHPATVIYNLMHKSCKFLLSRSRS